MSALNRAFLRRFTVSYTQPPEFPPETADNPTRGEEIEGDWTAYMGQMVRSNEEMEGESRRRPKEVDLKFDTRLWHRLSNTPERFLETQTPRLAMNAFFRTMIHGTTRLHNPMIFVLLPEAARAAARRDLWIRSSWPFFQERAIPDEGADFLEVARFEAQQVMLDCANRIPGAIKCRRGGDPVAGEKHERDAWGRYRVPPPSKHEEPRTR
jgi:hypothetical protein